jgi:outer membrane protein assembly factor BamB
MVPLRFEGRDFILCPGDPILDAATGNLVGKPSMGSSDARRGHTVPGGLVICTPDMKVGCNQITLKGDAMESKLLWSCKGAPWHCSIVYDGNVYFPKDTAWVQTIAWVPLDGNGVLTPRSIVKSEPAWKIPKDLIPPPAEGKKSSDVAKCWQYAAPSVADGHLFVGDDTQGILVVKLAGEKSEVVSRNFMDLFIRGNPFFQGNRMYVRSMHYMYCIGK